MTKNHNTCVKESKLFFIQPYIYINMARKKTAEPKVFVPAALSDTKWINTPFAYARLARDLTLLQQNVLLKVSDQLQDYITQFFQDNRNLLPDDPNSLFTPEATMSLPKLELRLSDFGIDKSRYGEVHKAASAVSDLRIKAPNIQDDGSVNGYKMFPVFDEIEVPKTDETAPDDEKYNYRTGVIHASINPKVAAYAFNMRLGYINHPAEIAADANQVYSTRVYFVIKHYLQKNKMSVTIPYDKLREDLGMIVIDPETGDTVDHETGEPLTELYPQFSRFCTNVLDKAQEDINRMAELNLIDITFTYIPIYKGRQNRGDPESIQFDIEYTELGRYHKLPRSARPSVTKAAATAETRRRGRPRKQTSEDNQQTIMFDEPQLIPGNRVGEWQKLVADYADGPSAELLSLATCLGTLDDAFALEVPSRQHVDQLTQAAIADTRLKELLVQSVGRSFKTIQVSCK